MDIHVYGDFTESSSGLTSKNQVPARAMCVDEDREYSSFIQRMVIVYRICISELPLESYYLWRERCLSMSFLSILHSYLTRATAAVPATTAESTACQTSCCHVTSCAQYCLVAAAVRGRGWM